MDAGGRGGLCGEEDPLRCPRAQRDRQEALPPTSLLAIMVLPASRARHRHPQPSLLPSLVLGRCLTSRLRGSLGGHRSGCGKKRGLRAKCFEELRPLESLGGGETRFHRPAQPHGPGPAETHARACVLPACVRGRVRGCGGPSPGSLLAWREHRPELCNPAACPRGSGGWGSLRLFRLLFSQLRVRTRRHGGFPDTPGGGRGNGGRGGARRLWAGNLWAFQALQTQLDAVSLGQLPRPTAWCWREGAGHTAQRGR